MMSRERVVENWSAYECAFNWICKALGFQHFVTHEIYPMRLPQTEIAYFELNGIACQDTFDINRAPFTIQEYQEFRWSGTFLSLLCGPYQGTWVVVRGIDFPNMALPEFKCRFFR